MFYEILCLSDISFLTFFFFHFDMNIFFFFRCILYRTQSHDLSCTIDALLTTRTIFYKNVKNVSYHAFTTRFPSLNLVKKLRERPDDSRFSNNFIIALFNIQPLPSPSPLLSPYYRKFTFSPRRASLTIDLSLPN